MVVIRQAGSRSSLATQPTSALRSHSVRSTQGHLRFRGLSLDKEWMHGAGAIELVERDLQNTSDHAPEMMRIQLHEIAPMNTRGTKKFVLHPMALYNANRMEGPYG